MQSHHSLDQGIIIIIITTSGIIIYDHGLSFSLHRRALKSSPSQTLSFLTLSLSCSQSAKRAILLSGTPALSRPSELFPQV